MEQILWIIFFSPEALMIGGLAGLWECWRFWGWFRKSREPGRHEPWAGMLGAGQLPIWWTLIYLVAVIALSVLAYALTPKVKTPKPDSTKQFDDPVAEAGMPIPVVFGTMTVKQLNTLWFGDKRKIRYKVKA